jgi:hypothetical protein
MGWMNLDETVEKRVHFLDLFSYNEHRLTVNAKVQVRINFPLKGKNRNDAENGAARDRNRTLAEGN